MASQPVFEPLGDSRSSCQIPLRSSEETHDDEYDMWMMEDHPLRAFPKECCPSIIYFLESRYRVARRNWGEGIFRIVCLLLMVAVLVQAFVTVYKTLPWLLVGENWADESWDRPGDGHPGSARWPDEWKDYDRSISCLSYYPHAHFKAIQNSLEYGCTGLRTDIWLHQNQILVGESIVALDSRHTLQNTYLGPLWNELELLSHAPGQATSLQSLFDAETNRTFVLVLNFKSPMQMLWPQVDALLDPFRQKGYLTHLNGSQVVHRPVTVMFSGRVASGDMDMVAPDIFFDRTLDDLVLEDEEEHPQQSPKTPPGTAANVMAATANFKESIGRPHRGRFSPRQVELIRAQVQAAHRRGLLARYEGLPQWHGKLRDLIWQTLVQAGADLIEVEGGRW
ncbi:hypothetical protein ASPZODRAFT_132095 [Penicilliopsis zonata CBS 506.65]|uniref:Altered inheritance of mitochondria protein 6 n=1 Tax=Penicilliopsis zonata CBS 506.65 TaxID=1073090 RepID=A0A1L9SJC6_9EURO|nr:hypothetical protein ASPZODRAFT_132095 [Penicilliopsis zonata CBS 506.65]OJJ47144.1 hypothetical protein ASPZODRAFT_132095 [Penicilliopsis zonata CBS 506.65]